jgi:hypothetical protein
MAGWFVSRPHQRQKSMQRRNYYKNDPRWITARYPGRCYGGTEIKPGDDAMYYPLTKDIACADCGRVTEIELIDDDNNSFINR